MLFCQITNVSLQSRPAKAAILAQRFRIRLSRRIRLGSSNAGQLLGMYDDSKNGKAAAAPPGERKLRAGEDGSAEDGNEPPSVEQTGDALQRWGVCNLLHHGRNFFRCRLCFNVMVQKLSKIDGIPTRRFKHRDLPSTDPRSERFR